MIPGFEDPKDGLTDELVAELKAIIVYGGRIAAELKVRMVEDAAVRAWETLEVPPHLM